MDVLTSSEFRKRYASLREPTGVTVNGHIIGTWTPAPWFPDAERERIAAGDLTRSERQFVANIGGVVTTDRHPLPRLAQSERDAILRKVNRKS